MSHFKTLLHNFGFRRLSRKEVEDFTDKIDQGFLKKQGVDYQTVKYVIARRWSYQGSQDEARECFKLFDKRDKDTINATDLK